MFTNGFPSSLKIKHNKVISLIDKSTSSDISSGASDGYGSLNEWYLLSSLEKVNFPYRIYFIDMDSIYDSLTSDEKLIYDCIFTRHCDGFIREKHLKNILNSDLKEWCLPYIIRLSSEYVFEILEVIYSYINDNNKQLIQKFCFNNPLLMKRSYQRMASYWNEYYRDKYPWFNNFIGYKLFHECFMPRTNFEKIK